MALGVVPARFVTHKRWVLLCVCKKMTDDGDGGVNSEKNSRPSKTCSEEFCLCDYKSSPSRVFYNGISVFLGWTRVS